MNAIFGIKGLCAAAALAALAEPIVMRHDRANEQYVALGDRFADVIVDINVPRRQPKPFRGGNGTGVLVHPSWVLTAAHVAAALVPGHPMNRVQGGHTLTVGGQELEFDRVVLHPEWRDGGPHDIALIRLKRPITGKRTAELYERADESGKSIVLVGRGDSGTGLTGPATADGMLRGATNIIDRVRDGALIFDFDAPGSEATELEGISGPGDSGGPALHEANGKLYVMGISVAGDGQGRGPGRYGQVEFYSRVSFYRDWLLTVIEAEPIRK